MAVTLPEPGRTLRYMLSHGRPLAVFMLGWDQLRAEERVTWNKAAELLDEKIVRIQELAARVAQLEAAEQARRGME
jgi:hypothetical protein